MRRPMRDSLRKAVIQSKRPGGGGLTWTTGNNTRVIDRTNKILTELGTLLPSIIGKAARNVETLVIIKRNEVWLLTMELMS
jgi:hypothetical protein